MSDDKKMHTKTIILKKLKPDSYRFWVSAASATLQVHQCLDIVLGREPNPTPNDGNISTTLRKTINNWESRHAQAREALLNALEDSELVKVYHSNTSMRSGTDFLMNSRPCQISSILKLKPIFTC